MWPGAVGLHHHSTSVFKESRIMSAYNALSCRISYSTVEDFLSYAHRNRILRSILQSVPPSENPVERLQMLPRQGTCKLGMVYDMLKLFTEGLRKHKRVESITGTVTFATRDSIVCCPLFSLPTLSPYSLPVQADPMT